MTCKTQSILTPSPSIHGPWQRSDNRLEELIKFIRYQIPTSLLYKLLCTHFTYTLVKFTGRDEIGLALAGGMLALCRDVMAEDDSYTIVYVCIWMCGKQGNYARLNGARTDSNVMAPDLMCIVGDNKMTP